MARDHKIAKAREGKYEGENNSFFGKSHTEESRQKISKNRKGKLIGKDNPMFGKTHSEETLKKIAATKKRNKELKNK